MNLNNKFEHFWIIDNIFLTHQKKKKKNEMIFYILKK